MTQHTPQAWKIKSQKIVLENLILPVRIGIYDYERHGPQRLRISVAVNVVPDDDLGSDHFHSVVDYDFIQSGIRAFVQDRHFELQETLAAGIIDLCFSKSRVLEATVSIAKLDIYADSDAIGVELRAERVAR